MLVKLLLEKNGIDLETFIRTLYIIFNKIDQTSENSNFKCIIKLKFMIFNGHKI